MKKCLPRSRSDSKRRARTQSSTIKNDALELSTFGTGFAFGGGTSDLWIGGTYIQKGPAASLKISAGSQFNAASQEYHVLGGSVEVVPEILEFGENVHCSVYLQTFYRNFTDLQ